MSPLKIQLLLNLYTMQRPMDEYAPRPRNSRAMQEAFEYFGNAGIIKDWVTHELMCAPGGTMRERLTPKGLDLIDRLKAVEPAEQSGYIKMLESRHKEAPPATDALTDKQITAAIDEIYMIDYANPEEYEVAIVRAAFAALAPTVQDAEPAQLNPYDITDIEHAQFDVWQTENDKYIVAADFWPWLERAYVDGRRAGTTERAANQPAGDVAQKACASLPPGHGFCDMCASGKPELCRYAAPTPQAAPTVQGSVDIPTWKDRARHAKDKVMDAASATKYMEAELADLRHFHRAALAQRAAVVEMAGEHTEKLLWVLRTVRAIADLGRFEPLGEWYTQAVMVCGTLKRVLGDTPEAIEAGTSDTPVPPAVAPEQSVRDDSGETIGFRIVKCGSFIKAAEWEATEHNQKMLDSGQVVRVFAPQSLPAASDASAMQLCRDLVKHWDAWTPNEADDHAEMSRIEAAIRALINKEP